MSKAALLEKISASQRQLNRYLFYFERDSDGVFRPTDRLKFTEQEALQPGLLKIWSLKDLLGHLVAWEQRWLSRFRGEEADVTPAGVILGASSWASLGDEAPALPSELMYQPIDQLCTRLKAAQKHVAHAVAAIDEGDLFTPGHFTWAGTASAAEVAVVAFVQHTTWVKKHVRRWRKTHTGTHLNKNVLLEKIETERRRLEANLAQLTPEMWEEPGVIGRWSPKDLVAHLFAWEQLFLGWYQAGVSGQEPAVPAPGISWADLDLLNRQMFERYQAWSFDRVTRASSRSFQQILATVKGMDEAEIFEPGSYAWVGENHLAGFILANTAHHYRWAKQQLRRWQRELASVAQ